MSRYNANPRKIRIFKITKEAIHIVATYVGQWEKKFLETFQSTQKKEIEAKFQQHWKHSSTPTVPLLESDLELVLAETNVTIDSTGEEFIVDVIGLYITGVKICLSVVEGQESLMQVALGYAKRALVLFRDHVANDSSKRDIMMLLKTKVYQALGVVYGELAQEGFLFLI